jgi:hypothetical protein
MADIGTQVLFIAGFGPIDHDIAESRKLYADSLGISFKEDAGGYLYTAALQGAKHFALWPLSQAAQSCFGTDSWPDKIPVPQAWLEFEVENAYQEQEGTVGPNRKPVPLTRGPAGRCHIHSVAAGKEIVECYANAAASTVALLLRCP